MNDLIHAPIKTQRLLIRHVELNDWRALQDIWNAISRTEYAQYDGKHTTDDASMIERITAWTNACKGVKHLFWVVCLNNEVIGFFSFNKCPHGYEVGYGFHPKHHGNGYAYESFAALIDLIKKAGVTELCAGTALKNTPSVKLLTKSGFKLVETESVSFYKDKNGNDIFFDGGIFKLYL